MVERTEVYVYDMVERTEGSTVLSIHETIMDCTVHQSSMSCEFSAGFGMIPSINPHSLCARNKFFMARADSS